MGFCANWVVQADASLRVDYTDAHGDPCSLAITPSADGIAWAAVATYATWSGSARNVVSAMKDAEDLASTQDWSEV